MKAVGKYIGKVLKRQDGKCPHCLQLILAEDIHHLHSVDGDKTNKGLKNVLLLHKACKKGFEYIKRNTSLVRPSKWALVMPEPYAGKLACTVLGELGGGDAARLPGGFFSIR